MCKCVCSLFLMNSQFRADRHEIWRVASLYPTDGHRELAHGLALSACPYVPTNEWRAPPRNSEPASSRHNASSPIGAWAPLGNSDLAASDVSVRVLVVVKFQNFLSYCPLSTNKAQYSLWISNVCWFNMFWRLLKTLQIDFPIFSK